MKLHLRHRVNMAFALVIVLCASGGNFVDEQNHDKMKLTHEEEVRLVKNDKKDIVEKRRGKRTGQNYS